MPLLLHPTGLHLSVWPSKQCASIQQTCLYYISHFSSILYFTVSSTSSSFIITAFQLYPEAYSLHVSSKSPPLLLIILGVYFYLSLMTLAHLFL
jgi:hypothetical protein